MSASILPRLVPLRNSHHLRNRVQTITSLHYNRSIHKCPSSFLRYISPSSPLHDCRSLSSWLHRTLPPSRPWTSCSILSPPSFPTRNHAHSYTTLSPPPSPEEPSAPAQASNWNLANALTVSRILAAPLAAHFILTDSHDLALLTVITAGLTDALDGYVARRYSLQTTLGTYLDPAADKALVATCFGALAVQGVFPVWLVGIVVGRDVVLISFAVHGLRKKMLTSGTLELPPMDVQPLAISKVNTALQLSLTIAGIVYGGGYAFVPEVAIQGLSVATASTTVASFLGYVYKHFEPRMRRL